MERGNDTITFALDGEIGLRSFVQAIKEFSGLIEALSVEEGDPEIKWVVDDLAPGSAVATIRGFSPRPESVEKVVRAYNYVGRSLQRDEPIRRSRPVVQHARNIGRMVGQKVKAVTFQTAEADAIVTRPPRKRQRPSDLLLPAPPEAILEPLQTGEQAPAVGAFGVIEGIVQTLTSRHGLRFTLYDVLADRPISCYLQPGHEEIMRAAWGRRALVHGWISRDPSSGRAIAIRRVIDVTPVSEEGDFTEARGVVPGPHSLSPEEAVRRLRDV